MFKKEKLILIGASTGGPGHLKDIFSNLTPDFTTPIIIAQHMNHVFIESFVKQFNSELDLGVVMSETKHCIEKKHIYVCAKHCELTKKGHDLELVGCDFVKSHYNPSIDHLFQSAIPFVKDYDILAILLTGIGQDGAMALSNLQKAGATCIAESKESAIVYGMPKAAIEINPNIQALSLKKIISKIKQFGGV